MRSRTKSGSLHCWTFNSASLPFAFRLNRQETSGAGDLSDGALRIARQGSCLWPFLLATFFLAVFDFLRYSSSPPAPRYGAWGLSTRAHQAPDTPGSRAIGRYRNSLNFPRRHQEKNLPAVFMWGFGWASFAGRGAAGAACGCSAACASFSLPPR